MGREENISVGHGNRRFTVAIPKPIAALNAPLRAAELEAMRPGREIGPADQANPEPEVCLNALALRAPLLCSMFRPSRGLPLDRNCKTLASKARTLCSRLAGSVLLAAGEGKKLAARLTDRRDTALTCTGRSARVSGDLWRWVGARFERLRRDLWGFPRQRRAD